MVAEKTGPPPSPKEGKAGLGQFVQNGKTDTASEKGTQDPYPKAGHAQFIVGAARYGLIHSARISPTGIHAVGALKSPPAMYTFHGSRFVTFHAPRSAHAVKDAMRATWRGLHALGIENPKEAIGPVRRTERADVGAHGGELAKRLEELSLFCDWTVPLRERWPGEHLWLDSLLWQPPLVPEKRFTGGGRKGWLVLEMDVDDVDDPVAVTFPYGMTTGPSPDGLVQARIEAAAKDDKAWFERHPGKTVRLRPFIPGESPPPPPGYEARVMVVQDEPGTRTREIISVSVGENASTGSPSSPWARK
jgi:hypothetical protein